MDLLGWTMVCTKWAATQVKKHVKEEQAFAFIIKRSAAPIKAFLIK